MARTDNISEVAKIYDVSRPTVKGIKEANQNRIAELLQQKKEAIDKQFTDYFKEFHVEGSKVVLGLLAKLWAKSDKASFSALAIALGIIADKLDSKFTGPEPRPTTLILKFPGYKNGSDKNN